MGRVLPQVLALALLASPAAFAQEPTPPELQGVEIVEHLGETPPLDLPFVDENGKAVKLRDYVQEGRPLILTLNYYECPMLCSMVLNGLVNGMKELAWTPGKEFQVVTVSINPRETPELAKRKQANYLEALGKPELTEGWHFLTGEEPNIRALAKATGFGYRYDPTQAQYAHGAVIFMLSPAGVLTRYLYGIEFPTRDLRLALVEASEGHLGSVADKILLYCFHYVPASQRYEFWIWGAMRLGGVLTILLVGGMLVYFWRRERRRSKAAVATT